MQELTENVIINNMLFRCLRWVSGFHCKHTCFWLPLE